MGGELGDWLGSGPKMVFLRVDVDFLNIPKGFLGRVDASTGQFQGGKKLGEFSDARRRTTLTQPQILI
jgi:hypothetical protein